MRVRFDRNFGIPQEFLMHNSVFCRLSGLCFFHWSVALLTFSLKCDRSHWKVKIVLLNFKITRTENFSLAKSLRSTYKEVYFLLKMNSFKAIFQNIVHLISKILPTVLKITPSSKHTYFKEHLFLAVST